MAMGYGANYADVIEPETLGGVVGDKKLVNGFVKKFNNYKFKEWEISDYRELATTVSGENINFEIDAEDKAFKSLEDDWKKISSKFKEVTGLELSIDYHSIDDNGDRYDNVDGLYFQVYGLYQPTKKFREFKKKFGDEAITRAFFVTFG